MVEVSAGGAHLVPRMFVALLGLLQLREEDKPYTWRVVPERIMQIVGFRPLDLPESVKEFKFVPDSRVAPDEIEFKNGKGEIVGKITRLL